MAQLLYYNMMTPNWLNPQTSPQNKADWRRANQKKFEDLRIVVGPDTMPYEKICTVPLLSKDTFANLQSNPDIIIRMNIGLEIGGTKQIIDERTKAIDMPTKPVDPIIFMVTDGSNAIGMVIQDVTKDHDINGPYYGIQGTLGPTALSVDKSIGQQLVRTSAKSNPDEFRLTFKPSDYWGEAYSALDGGHKALVYYNKTLKYNNGLNLQICRVDPKGEFKINYVEVTVLLGSSPP